MKYALITDTHWGVRGDSREFLDHMIKFYREVFWPAVDAAGVTQVIHLGDIVDRRKFINFVTLKALREEFIEEAERRGVTLRIIVGNHDIPFRNTNEVNAVRETFMRYEHVILYEKPAEIYIDGCRILMMPWINNTNQDQAFQIIKDTKAQIMFGHLEIKGFEMYRGLPSHEGYDPKIFDKFDIVASGHFHKKSTQGNIHYLGAPYEMTWSDYNCPRGFHFFDTATREFEYVRNPLHMFHKVFYDDKNMTALPQDLDFGYLENTYVKAIVQHKANPYLFDMWLNKVYEAKPIDVSVVDDNKNINELADDDIFEGVEDTRTILKSYVAAIETRVDKNDLDKLVQQLYDEAIQLEVLETEC